MNGQLVGRLKRLSIVLGVLAWWQIGAIATWRFAVAQDGNGYSAATCKQWDVKWYGPKPSDCTYYSHWWSFHPSGDSEWFGVYLLGGLVALIAAIVLAGCVWFLVWLWCGPSKYVDPCQDPHCPCPRHIVEREEAEMLRTAAIAAGTAAATKLPPTQRLRESNRPQGVRVCLAGHCHLYD